jgi:putative flippase GtrA
MTSVRQVPGTSSEGALSAWELRLRGPGLLQQGARYLLVGGAAAISYLGTTTVLADVIGLPFQVALAVGFCVGLLVHFTLQRLFVWAHHDQYALPLRHQVVRYLVFAGAQYALTAVSTSVLPRALGLPVDLVYFGTVVILISTNFLVFRNVVFHRKAAHHGQPS